jgi:hypothetical protein
MNVRVWWCWRHGLAPGPSARRPRAVLCSSSVRKRSPVRAPDCLAAAAQMAWARSELLNLLCRPRHSWLPAVLPTERPPCPADTSWTRGFTWEGDTCSGVPAPGVRRRGRARSCCLLPLLPRGVNFWLPCRARTEERYRWSGRRWWPRDTRAPLDCRRRRGSIPCVSRTLPQQRSRGAGSMCSRLASHARALGPSLALHHCSPSPGCSAACRLHLHVVRQVASASRAPPPRPPATALTGVAGSGVIAQGVPRPIYLAVGSARCQRNQSDDVGALPCACASASCPSLRWQGTPPPRARPAGPGRGSSHDLQRKHGGM